MLTKMLVKFLCKQTYKHNEQNRSAKKKKKIKIMNIYREVTYDIDMQHISILGWIGIVFYTPDPSSQFYTGSGSFMNTDPNVEHHHTTNLPVDTHQEDVGTTNIRSADVPQHLKCSDSTCSSIIVTL